MSLKRHHWMTRWRLKNKLPLNLMVLNDEDCLQKRLSPTTTTIVSFLDLKVHPHVLEPREEQVYD